MKKITSFIFMLTLLFSTFGFSYAEEEITANTDYNLELLSTLGIISEQDVKTPQKPVSRKEFVLYAARAIAVDEYQNTEKRYYIDIPVDDFAAGAVNSLTERGILTVNEDKRFRPDDTVTLQEACKILTCAMGYESYAEAAGGFPTGYMSAAENSSIIRGVSGTMDLYNVARLIRNALEAPLFKLDTVSADKTIYLESDTETIFSLYHDIYIEEGTLSAVYGASISTVFAADKNRAYVGEQCFIAEEDTEEYFGNYVKAYYKMAKDDYMGSIVFLMPDCKTEDVVIDIDDFDKYENNTVTYYENNTRKRSVNVDSHIKIVYNGEILTSDINNTFEKLNKGTITLKDSKDTGDYDVMVIWDWNSIVFEQKATEEEDTLYSKHSDPVKLDEYYAVRIVDKNGETVMPNKLENGDVLSVAASKNKEAIKIFVSRELVSGEVESTRMDEQELFIMINSTEYSVDKNHVSRIYEVTSLKNTFNFSLDVFGDIVFAAAAAQDTMKFGYLTEYHITDDQDGMIFKIFTSDNEFIRVEGASSVNVNKRGYKKPSAIETALQAGQNQAPQLIRFALNESGEICRIDTCYVSDDEDEKSSLFRSQESEEVNYKNNRFGIKTMVNGYVTTILYVPEDSEVKAADKDEFLFVGVWNAGLEADNKYKIEAFKLSEDDDFPSVVVCRGGNLTQSYDEIILVDKIYEALNDDGECVTFIRGLQRTKFVDQEIESDAEFVTTLTGGIPTALSSVKEIEEGDVIRCMTNRGGRATKVNRVYDYSSKDLPTWGGIKETVNWYDGTKYGQFFQLSYGYVSKKGEQIVKWGYKNPGDFDEEYNLAILPIMVYDPKKRENRVYSGTMDDIYSSELVGESECSRIIFRSSQSTGSCAVIYND